MALPEDDLLALSNLSNARHKAEDATPRDGIESERPRAGSRDKCFRQCRICGSQFTTYQRNSLRCSGDFLCRCVSGGVIVEKLNRGLQLVAFFRNDCFPLACEGESSFPSTILGL